MVIRTVTEQVLVRMSNAREAPPCHIELRASKRLAVLLSAGHFFALAISTLLALSTPVLALLCTAVALSWYRTLERHALLRSSRSVVALALEGEQSCALQMRNGRWVWGRVMDSSYVLPWLVVLHASIEQRKFATRVVLCADSMPQESHRRLRVRLRWARYDEKGIERTDAPL